MRFKPFYDFALLVLALVAISIILFPYSFTGFVSGSNVTTANVSTTVTVQNVAPSMLSVVTDASIGLTAARTITAFCNVTASDANGGADIAVINATLRDSVDLSIDDVGDNRSKFINSSCMMNAPQGNVRTANCTFQLPYMTSYNPSGSWVCRGQAFDAAQLASSKLDSSAFVVPQCVGMFINPGDVAGSSIAFGSLNPGSSVANVSLNVSNTCNTQIDLLTQGINLTSGSNVIGIRNVTYTFVPWDVTKNVNVTHVGDAAGGFNLTYDLTPQTSQTFGNYSNRSMWFNLTIPQGQPSGTYVGALNFTAQVG